MLVFALTASLGRLVVGRLVNACAVVHCVTLSLGHLVTRSSCCVVVVVSHRVTWSLGHLVVSRFVDAGSLRHLVTWSPGHLVPWSLVQGTRRLDLTVPVMLRLVCASRRSRGWTA